MKLAGCAWKADQRSAVKFDNSGHWECFDRRPVAESAGGNTSSASAEVTGRNVKFPNGSKDESLVFRSTELFELMESLILAQDERWRRA